MNLELLVYNEDTDEEYYIPLTLEIEAVTGFYNSVDDDDVVNIVSYGQIFSVKKTHALMSKLNFKLN